MNGYSAPARPDVSKQQPRYQSDRSFEENLRRLLVTQLQQAATVLETIPPGHAPLEQAIHEARVACKRVIAYLALIPNQRSISKLHKLVTRSLRSTSRARDATAVRQSVHQHNAGHVKKQELARLKKQRRKKLRRLRKTGLPVTIQLLHQGAVRASKLPISGTDRDLMKGIARSYRAARRAMPASSGIHLSQPRRWHHWRKHCKCHLYQIELLAPAPASILSKHLANLTNLGRVLGDYHDLAIARKHLSHSSNLALGQQLDISALKLLIQAFEQGSVCFSWKTRAFRRELKLTMAAIAQPAAAG